MSLLAGISCGVASGEMRGKTWLQARAHAHAMWGRLVRTADDHELRESVACHCSGSEAGVRCREAALEDLK
jgi:hypothetical protein